MANKIGINTVNDNQKDFVFELMKRCNVSSFFIKHKTKDLDNKSLSERSKLKAIDILLKCEKSTDGIKTLLRKTFKRDINQNQKSILLNAMMLFDIRNAIFSLFRNGFIKPLEYQNQKQNLKKVLRKEQN